MKHLRTGFTTGTFAAAAAKACALFLSMKEISSNVEVTLPDGVNVRIPIINVSGSDTEAEAVARKESGDDPDVTNGVLIIVKLTLSEDPGIMFLSGEGVGIVTKRGLSITPGEPAINPVPRIMIKEEVQKTIKSGVCVTISIPEGKELAKKTFNPRLGIIGGLSILGTSGRVLPYSCVALRESLKCTVDIAEGAGITAPVFVPGNIGERSARKYFNLHTDQVVPVGNEWGYILDQIKDRSFKKIMVLGHPGKLAKLAFGQWDTHSSRSESALPFVLKVAKNIIGDFNTDSSTVEGVIAALPQDKKVELSNALASSIMESVCQKLDEKIEVAVVLINMEDEIVGVSGDLSQWKR